MDRFLREAAKWILGFVALPQGWEVAPIDPGKGWYSWLWLKKTRTLPLKSFTDSSFSMFFLDVCFFCDERHSYCNTDIFFHEILWINRQKNWDSKMEIYLKNRLFDWGALNWRESGRWMGDIFGWDWSAWRMRQRFMVTKYIHSTNRSQKILSIMGFQITNAYSLLWWNFHNRSVIKAAD